MSINFATATREEIEAYVKELEQQVSKKRTNKTDKLLSELQEIFSNYSDNSTDKLLWLHFLLSVLFSNLSIPVQELLENLDTEPEEDDIKKLIITQVKELIKTDDFKLRKSKKNSVVVDEIVEEKKVNTPL